MVQAGGFMAKRNNEPTSIADKAKVRVFFAEVEGNNESVQEALRTMVSAMSRPVRLIPEPRAHGNDPVLLERPDLEEIEDAVEEGEESATLDEEVVSSIDRKSRGAGKKRDRNAGLKLVPNLNFMPGGKKSFKDFVRDKNPRDDLETALATVYYMQNDMAVTKIGPAHVMTAFKEAGKAIPADVRQTLRNVKKSKIWLNFTDLDDVRTTTQGDNFVEHDMGKGNTT
jgi:hypothetical protein